MRTAADKVESAKSSVASATAKTTTGSMAAALPDRRPAAAAQRQLQAGIVASPRQQQAATLQRAIDNSPRQQAASAPLQKKENKTGLPDELKAGVENLSGFSLDDVQVHYNSAKPAQLQAHAYAQGTDIHVAPGQEEHLPHEAWHVVQQKQGRVRPTMQLKGKVAVNDDAGLEKEADVMGHTALQLAATQLKENEEPKQRTYTPQGVPTGTIQRIADTNSQPQHIMQFVLTEAEVEEWADDKLSEEDYEYLPDDEKEQIGRYKAAKAAKKKQDEEWEAALESRVDGTKCVSWDYGGKNYHINLGQGPYHVTEEASPKIHYFFSGFGSNLIDKPSGNGAKNDKLFSALPSNVQTFIKANFNDLLL